MSLCRELERIERCAVRDLHAAQPAAIRRGLGLAVHEVGPALVLIAHHSPSLLLNRVIGLDGRGGSGAVNGALHYFARHDVRRFFVHLGPESDTAALRGWLHARGVVRYPRSWDKLARGRERVPPSPTKATIRPARPTDAVRIGELVAQGFDLDPLTAQIYGRPEMIGRAGWHHFVACDPRAADPDRAIGAGAVYVDGDEAYLAFGTTDSAHRRRGIQGALLAQRIRCALDSGCRRVVTETGQSVAHESNSSHNNMRRLGFHVVCSRDNYAPTGTTWTPS